MDDELLGYCRRTQERAAAVWKYCKRYPTVFGNLEEAASALYREDRIMRGVE